MHPNTSSHPGCWSYSFVLHVPLIFYHWFSDLFMLFTFFIWKVYDKGRQQAGQGQGHSLNYPAVIPSSMSTSDDRVRSSSSAATPLSTPTKARNSNSNSNVQPSDNDIEKSVREEVTWSSPLRGFTSSLFSLSASSLRYRVLTNGHTNGHTPDHTHSTEKM